MSDGADSPEAEADLLMLLAGAYGVRDRFEPIYKQVGRRALGRRPALLEDYAVALVLSALVGEPGIVGRLQQGLGQSAPFREALLGRLYFLKPPRARAALADQVVAEVTSALKVI